MNVALRTRMTVESFLTWEERQLLRYEFDGVQPVAMTGGTLAHARIQRNLAISIGGRLRGSPCEFIGNDVKIVTAATVRYSDGFVVCSNNPNDSTKVTDPVVIFEVLSPRTASVDATLKNREYASIASVKRYVMLEQDRIGAIVFSRENDDWIGHVLADDGVLHMPEIGATVPLAELYEGLSFPDSAVADDVPPDA